MGEPEKIIGEMVNDPQMTISGIPFKEGIGFTVIEKVLETPVQVFENGVTVINEVIGTFDTLVPVNALKVAVPVSAINPVKAVELVQLYWVLAKTEPEKVTGIDKLPIQIF